MKQLGILIVLSFLFLSCQKEELDCLKEKEEINARFKEYLERDNLTPKERESLENQWDIELKEAC